MYSVDTVMALTAGFKELVNTLFTLNDQEKERARLLKEINKEQEAQQRIKEFVDPITQIREQQERSLATQKEYNRLLMEGVLPSEAKRISEFNEQVKLQLTQIDAAIVLAEAEANRLKSNELLTKEYQNQLEEIENLKKARGAVAAEANKGPGKGRTSDKDII